MIEKVVIATLAPGQLEITGPPGRVVEVQVIAGMAYLGVREVGESGTPAAELTGGDELVVPAKSLLRALTAAIEDDEAPSPAHFTKPSAARR